MSRAVAVAVALVFAAGCTETIELPIRIEVAAGQNGCPDSLDLIEFPFAHSIHLHVFSQRSDMVTIVARDCEDIEAEAGRDIRELPRVLSETIDIGPLEPSGELVFVELAIYHQQVAFCEPFAQDRGAALQLFARTEVRLDEDPVEVSLLIECVTQ